MSNNERGHSRRDVLRTAAAVGATGLTASVAGCQQVKNAVGLGSNRTNQAPEDAEMALYVDVQAALEDEGVKTLTNAYLEALSGSEYYEGPSDFEEAREQFEDEADLDPSEANWQLAFGEQGGTSDYYGTLYKGSWDEDDVVDAFEDNYGANYDEDDHEGRTVYEPEEEYQPYIGVVGDSKYVTGSQDAVEDTIDVAHAGGDKMDEELRNAYGNTRNAPARFVTSVPGDIGENSTQEDLDPTALQDVETVAGSVYRDGDLRGVEATMAAEDEDAAEDVAELVEGYLAKVENDEYTAEAIQTIADDATVEQNGSDVVVSYEAEISELEGMIEDSFDSSGSGYGTRTPTGTY